MLGNEHFYNRTIRKVVVAFGTLFNDIKLYRYLSNNTTETQRFKVPLNYGAKEKYLTRLLSDPTLTKSIATLVPRISFDMTGMEYDSSRKQVSTLMNFAANTSSSIRTQYAPVPYNFNFSLSIYVRNQEDGTQILEQILPFFTPDFTVTVDFMSEMDQKYDMPVILNSVTPQTEYEGDFSGTRLIIWNLDFTAKGYIFPPMKTGKVIRQANTNVLIDLTSPSSQKVYVDFANGNGVFTTGETIRVNDRGVTGTMQYFSNANNGLLIVESLNKNLQIGDVVQGDYSHASYIINTLDVNPGTALTVVTTPDPNTATINTAFGFSEEITEYL
jgi:hypothetical protein